MNKHHHYNQYLKKPIEPNNKKINIAFDFMTYVRIKTNNPVLPIK